jgi:hypothetical protein
MLCVGFVVKNSFLPNSRYFFDFAVKKSAAGAPAAWMTLFLLLSASGG